MQIFIEAVLELGTGERQIYPFSRDLGTHSVLCMLALGTVDCPQSPWHAADQALAELDWDPVPFHGYSFP